MFCDMLERCSKRLKKIQTLFICDKFYKMLDRFGTVTVRFGLFYQFTYINMF